ncbi:MAG: hypothetical protein ACD_41C00058G0007 [uncultured bacterium]|nr:MAG: hypothetical protein ACD_41C00058G0007 [uncultured bacterium]
MMPCVTPFAQKVYTVVRSIPRGKFLTYQSGRSKSWSAPGLSGGWIDFIKER